MLYKIYNIYIIINVLFFSVKYNSFLSREHFLSYQRIHIHIYIYKSLKSLMIFYEKKVITCYKNY